ncbi:MAG TPA: MFS transporter [Lactobacillaceae bacterium]|jgi:predicted MFS family arabinose efflux permease
MQSERIFSRTFLQIALINFLMLVGFYSLIVTIGPYAVNQLHASAAIGGLLVGMTVIGSLVARLFSSVIATKLQTKQMMLLGTIVLVPAMFLYHWATGIAVLLVLRFIQGLSVGLVGTVTNTAVVHLIPENRRSEGISYFSLSTVIATALGPFAGLLIMQNGTYATLFNFETALAVLALIATIFVSQKTITVPNHVTSAPKERGLAAFIEPKVIPLALALLVAALTYAAVQTYLSFYLKAQGMGSYASYFFLIFAGIVFISRPFTGRLVDQRNENWVVYPGLILLALGFVVLSQVHDVWTFVLSALLIGLGFGNFNSTIQATIAKIVPPHRIGHGTSTYFIFFDIAFGFGPYLLGLIEPSIGFQALFTSMIAVSVVALVLYYLVHGRHVRA